jgi:hypothetical protein
MTYPEISSSTRPGTAKAPPFDRQQVLDRSLRAFARLEHMANTQRKTLEHAKTVEDYLKCLLKSKHALIKNMLDQWFTPESIADAILDELNGIKVSRRKLLGAIKRCAPTAQGDPPRKRIGPPPKNAAAPVELIHQPVQAEKPSLTPKLVGTRLAETRTKPNEDSEDRKEIQITSTLQTYFVDGDKGGVGKSLTTRALVHYFLSMEPDKRPVIAVFDADMSNPDVCGKDGLSTQNSPLALTQILDLSIEQGWIELANAVEKLQNEYEDEAIRIVINMPAQIGSRAFQGSVPIVSEVLQLSNAFPIWLLSRTQESIRTLEERIKAMPTRFQTGLVLRNLFFGAESKFVLWNSSTLQARMLQDNPEGELYWDENCLPEINDDVIAFVGRTPFHIALSDVKEKDAKGKNAKDKPFLSHGFRLTLQVWLRKTGQAFSEMEEFIEHTQSGQAASDYAEEMKDCNG